MNEISFKQFPINDDNDSRILKEQKLLAEIAQELTNPKKFAQSINEILSRIGKIVDVNRVYIFEDSDDRNFTSNTFEWCAKGTTPQIDKLQNVPYHDINSWTDILDTKGIIVTNNISKLPVELYNKLAPQNIKSILILPIKTDDKVFGFIGFDNTEIYRNWSSNEIYLLQTIAGILSNIYFRIEAESKFKVILKLQQSEKSEVNQIRQNYEDFFNSIDDFLFVLDENGIILNINKTVTDRLEYTKKELIGQSILYVHPADRQKEAQKIVAKMLIGKESVCPIPIVTKTGSQIPVETRMTKGSWNGNPVLFGITKDISQIQLSEEKFSKIFQMNPSACGLSKLTDNKYIEVNKSFCNLFGFSRNETIGKTAIELKMLSKETMSNIQSETDKNGNIINAEAQLTAKNGDVKNVLLSSENIYIQNNKYRFTVVHDITDLKKTEIQLKSKEFILKKALLASTEFLATSSSKIDYTKLTDTILKITDADYSSFNLFEENGHDFTTVALSGLNKNLLKVSSILGFEIINKKWEYDPIRESKIKNNTITIFNSLHELSGSVIPAKISSLIEKIFNIGQVVVIKIQKDNKAIGDFTLLFSSDRTIQNIDIVELFTNQVGLLIDRTKSENKLAISESRYHNYIENSPVAIFICNEKGQYINVNPSAEKITGYGRQELLTMSIPDILPPKSQELAKKLFETVAQKGHANAEIAFCRKDGSIGEWSLFSVRLSSTEFMGMCTDITERKQFENALRNSEEQSRVLVEQSPIAIELYDSRGLLVNVNPACLKLFGITDSKQIEKFSLFDDPNISADHKKALNQSKSIHFEAIFDFDIVTKNKLYTTTKTGKIWIDTTITPMKDKYDNITGYLLQIQDITKRMEEKKTIITSNDRLELALKSAKMGTWQYNVNQHKRIFDKQTCTLLALDPLKFKGSNKEYAAIIHPDDRQYLLKSIDNSVHANQPYQPEYRVIWPDKNIHYISERGKLIHNKETNTKFLYGIIWDNTIKKLAEERLAISEKKYSILINNSHDIIYTLSKEGIFTFVSPAWTTLLGHPISSVINQPFQRFVHPDDISKCLVWLNVILSSGMHQDNIEYRVKHIDGSWRWHTSSAIPIKDSQGTISGFEGTATDITDRKQLTENLMLSTERLTLATHAANIGIWDYDPTNNKLIWDEQMYKLYGLNADKFTGAYESWKAGLHPDDLQRSDHEIQMALRGEKEFDTEFRVLWPDKTVKYIRAIANVLRDPTGKALRMIGTNWDITDQKTIGEELLNKINELEKLNSLMIGRELKMIELKDEIAKLKSHINKVTKPTEDS